MRCGGMQDEAMSQPRAACTTCSQVGFSSNDLATLTLLEPDLGHFLGHPYDLPQYEASSLAFLTPRDPLLSVGRSRAAIAPQRPGKPPSAQHLNFCPPGYSVAAALGWDWDLQPLLPLFATLCDPPTPAFLPRDGGVANIPILAERPYRLDLVLTSVSIFFFSFSLSRPPIDEIAFRVADPYDPPLHRAHLFRLLVFIVA